MSPAGRTPAAEAGPIGRRTAGGLLGLSLIAVVDLVVRDRAWLVATLVHATPPIVLAVIAGLLGAFAAVRVRSRRLARAGAALAVAGLGWHLATAWRWSAPGAGPGLRVACWNVGRGSWGWEGVARTLRERDDDVVALIETGGDGPEKAAALTTAFPGRDWRALEAGLVVAVRGRVRDAQVVDLDGAGRAGLVTVDVAPRGAAPLDLDLLLVDIVANPLRDRTPAFEALDDLLLFAPRPRLVLGDFNTPRSSVHFDGWRAAGRLHAFEQAGRGCDATWPVPLPVLAIDHAWLEGSLRPLRCAHVATPHSDHRLVELEVSAGGVGR